MKSASPPTARLSWTATPALTYRQRQCSALLPMELCSRSWRALHADNRTQASPIIAIEPQQISDPRRQMPNMTDYRVEVLRPTASRPWNVNPGSSARVLQGGGLPTWLPTVAGFDLQWRAPPPPPPPGPACVSYGGKLECPGWPHCVWRQDLEPPSCQTPPAVT